MAWASPSARRMADCFSASAFRMAASFSALALRMADSVKMLNEAAPNDQVIKLKALESMQKIADGQATKIIIPSEMQGLVGLANGIVEGAGK